MYGLNYYLYRLNLKACREAAMIVRGRNERVSELRDGLEEIQDKLYDDADDLADRLFRNITDQDNFSPAAKHDDAVSILHDLRDLKTKYRDRVRELVR